VPIYEYQCLKCGALTDVRHGFDETTSQVCPTCGGELVRRFNPAGIVFKGSGFYVTDSRKPGASPSGDGPKGDGPKKESTPSSTPGSTQTKKSEGTAA
jgi:putative FmdB family regulatory protein